MSDKQIQIPETLFTQMAAYILMPEQRTDDLYNAIRTGIYDKIDRMESHKLYSLYKVAPTAEQREQARKDYLDQRGIHPDFRW